MPDAHGDARIGLVLPSTNTTVEAELPALRTPGASWFSTRVLQRETDDPSEKIATVLAMRDELDAATERLTGLGPVAIGFACTAASFLEGRVADMELCARLSDRTGVPFLTASTSVRQALGAAGARRIALVTPYIDEVNEREIAYFADAGVRTVTATGLGIVGNLPKGRLPLRASVDAVRETMRSLDGPVDAVFVSCTNWLTVGGIRSLESEFGVAVISSNSALAWALLRVADRAVPGDLGRLADLTPVDEHPAVDAMRVTR